MNARRSGVALLWALAVLSVLGVTSAVAVQEFATARRVVSMGQNRVQAEWFARAGAELAVGKLLADDKYTGETVQLAVDAPIRIAVEKDSAKPDVYRIKCEATFPADDYRAVHFALTRTATRRVVGGKVTIDLAAGSDAPPAP